MSVKEVHQETLFETLEKLRTKRKKDGKNHKNAANGLLCMRIADFLQKEEIQKQAISGDIEIAFYDSDDELHTIIAGEGRKKILATFDQKGNPVILQFYGKEYSFAPLNDDFVFQCDEINRVSLGKMIVKICGNEGTEDDENTAQIRKQLQAIITYLDKEKQNTWKDATITIYDRIYDAWKIRAGKGHAEFVANIDGYGELRIVHSSKY